jgi:uncharacterized protein
VTGVVILAAVLIAVGLVGILVPVVPGGSLLIAAAVLMWAWNAGGTAWVWFAVAAAVLAAGTIAKYALPHRRLAGAGVPATTQIAGAVLAIVGFFVVPVVGLFIGFVLGIYLAELRRVGGAAAWASTRAAVRAALSSIAIELAAGVVATVIWILAVATR